MIQEYFHFFKGSWPLLFFGMATVFWGNFGQSFFISWYGASFQESLHLSATSYGSLYSGATLISGLVLMWAGAALDKVPLHLFVLLSSLGLWLASILLWQMGSVVELGLGLFLLRFCGQGLLPHTAITTMSRTFVHNRGKAVSIASSGVPLGEIVLPSLAVLLIGIYGWQKSWLYIGLSIPCVFLPMSLWLLRHGGQQRYGERVFQKRHASRKKIGIIQGSRRTMLRDYRFWLALPSVLAAPFIITGLFIHQGFILPQMGWSPTLFASCFVFYGIAHWLSSMYTGALVDQFSGVQLFKYFPLPMFLALALCSFAFGEWVAYGLMILLGLSLGASSPIINGLWVEVYGTQNLGAIRAMVSSLAVLSTSVSPILFGFLIDGGISGQGLFVSLSIYVLVAMVLAVASFSELPPEHE